MASEAQLFPTGLMIFVLTFFLDVLELSFARMLWFIRTLRFWLYFFLHFGLSCLAAYLLHAKITDWYLLGPLATFLGVSVISNTNVKVAGYSLIPVAELFVSIKAKMFEQAAEDKASEVTRAQLIERLQKLSVGKIETVHRAGLMGANLTEEKVQQKVEKARKRAGGEDERYKSILISQLVKAHLPYVEKSITDWESNP